MRKARQEVWWWTEGDWAKNAETRAENLGSKEGLKAKSEF
jgi:hypothetical protein